MISVIIPTYNRASVLYRSIMSVLNQTYQDMELIIADDCSNDNTEEVVSAINDPRIVYIKQEINQGACVARNTGISIAKGDFIAFQDSDDIWYPDKLEKQLAALKVNDADFVFCKHAVRKLDGSYSEALQDYHEGFLKKDSDLFGIGTPDFFGKTEIFKDNLFDPQMPRFQDLELLIRISQKYSIYCLDEVLVECDTSSDSVSINPKKLVQACNILLKKYPSFRKDYSKTGKAIAYCLLYESAGFKDDKKLYDQMRSLAFKFDHGLKCLLKILLNYSGAKPQKTA